MRYVLGVDGGNTKTDYLLHDISGALVKHLRAGTCSHERLGMQGAKAEMGARIDELLRAADVRLDQIAAAAFGLAGVDQRLQQQALTDIVHELGFPNSIAMNDSFLGIKAGSETGTGVCSINGTGTAAGGIDANGNWVQVGGYGLLISGDAGGGSYLASRTIGAAYDAAFRFGPSTVLLPRLLALFGCERTEDLHLAISEQYMYGTKVRALDVISCLLSASLEGDAVAGAIVTQTAEALARSAAGCAVRLSFDESVPVVLIGSVWTKGRHQPMIDQFQAFFERYAKKKSTLHILTVPPAAGSVLWALELAGGIPQSAVRQRVFDDTQGL